MYLKDNELEIGKSLIGKNLEINKRIYVDDYLRGLTEKYGVPEFDIKENEEIIKQDLKLWNKFSGAFTKVIEIIGDAKRNDSWIGAVYKNYNSFESALESVIRAKKEEFPRNEIGSRRGLYDLLNDERVYSPNIECNYNFYNQIIIIPSEKLVRYVAGRDI